MSQPAHPQSQVAVVWDLVHTELPTQAPRLRRAWEQHLATVGDARGPPTAVSISFWLERLSAQPRLRRRVVQAVWATRPDGEEGWWRRCTGHEAWKHLLPACLLAASPPHEKLHPEDEALGRWALAVPEWRAPWCVGDVGFGFLGHRDSYSSRLHPQFIDALLEDPQLFDRGNPLGWSALVLEFLLALVWWRCRPTTSGLLKRFILEAPAALRWTGALQLWPLVWGAAHAGNAEAHALARWLAWEGSPTEAPALASLRTPEARWALLQWFVMIGLTSYPTVGPPALVQWLQVEATTATAAFTRWRSWWEAREVDAWTWCGRPWPFIEAHLPPAWQEAVAAWRPHSPSGARRRYLRSVWTWAWRLPSALRRWRRRAWTRLSRIAVWEEELIQAAWHPRRVWAWCLDLEETTDMG